MRTFGGANPFPRRFGGGETRLQQILTSLQADRGDAYSTDWDSVVYAENMAIARAVSAGWGTNERLGHLWVPSRTSPDVIERWEKMLVISPKQGQTWTERRAVVEERLTQHPEALRGYVLERMQTIGTAFVDVEYIPVGSARITVPDGTYPFGTTSTTQPWSSTVARILIRLQLPTGGTEGDFYDKAAEAMLLIDPFLPAWVEVDWYRPGPVSSAVAGGPSAAGFYLDDEHNLDNEIFD
jgi:uncharacterized protein YmfQ (DUF2313 family)